jgi:hypothetical protein
MKITDGIKLNEEIVLHAKKGEISETTIREAEEIVRKFDVDNSNGATFAFPSPQSLWNSDADWTNWMVDKGLYSGTWAKRYSSFVWKNYGCRPPESLIAKLGEILSKSANCENQYICDITDNFDWEPGTFGESDGSCWWGEFNHARTGLQRHGGLALRFYGKNGKGCGRCWIFPENDRMFIFNNYHKDNLTLYNMACLLATYLGVSYKRVRIDCPGAYINSEHGFMIAPVDVIAKLVTDECYVLNFADDEEDCYECDNCGRHHAESYDWYWTNNDERICERCWEYNYFSCYNCGGGEHNDYAMTGADENTYCSSCYEDRFAECDECGEVCWQKDLEEFDGEQLCENCLPEECSVCHERNLTLNDGVCPECEEQDEDNSG